MRNPIEVRCAFCGAEAEAPCRSVGERPIVWPHMARLHAVATPDEFGAAGEVYARSVVTILFGRCDDALLKRAQKDRSIDGSKAWVRRELARAEELGL